jgi:hypothetical protein
MQQNRALKLQIVFDEETDTDIADYLNPAAEESRQ